MRNFCLEIKNHEYIIRGYYKSFSFSAFITAVLNLIPIFFPFLAPGKFAPASST